MATEKRLIDASAYVDELKWLQEQVSSASAIEIQEYIDRTNRQPTVDAVEVVRCEKCRYYEKAEYDEGYKMVCRLLKRQTARNGFCYCGERKDND